MDSVHVEARLGDLGVFTKGGALSKGDLSHDGVHPVILYGELYTHYHTSVIVPVKSHTNEFTKGYKGAYGDIIFPTSGETAEALIQAKAVLKDGVLYGGDLIVFKPNLSLVDPRYLASFLSSQIVVRTMMPKAQGNTVAHISSKAWSDLLISLPSLPEQEKIADFLGALDDRIELQEKKIELLKERKRGWVQRIFNQQVRFRDDNGNEYPEWEERTLGEVAELKHGYAFRASEYSKSGAYKIVTIKHVKDRFVSTIGLDSISRVPKNLSPHQRLRIGDLLISLTGNVGRVSIVNEDGLLLNQRVGVIVPEIGVITPNFLYHLLSTDTFLMSMVASGQGGAQPNLSKRDVETYSFKLPHIAEQQKIEVFLTLLDELCLTQEKKLSLLKEQKLGYLQRIFA